MIYYELIHRYGWLRLTATTDEEAREEARLAVRRMGQLWEPKIFRIEKTLVSMEEPR